MEQLNKTLSSIDAQMGDASLYDTANKDKLKSMLNQQMECKKRLAVIEEEWMEKQEALEAVLTE